MAGLMDFLAPAGAAAIGVGTGIATGNPLLGVAAGSASYGVLSQIGAGDELKEALKNGYPLVDWEPEAATSRIIKEIAANLINQQYKTQA